MHRKKGVRMSNKKIYIRQESIFLKWLITILSLDLISQKYQNQFRPHREYIRLNSLNLKGLENREILNLSFLGLILSTMGLKEHRVLTMQMHQQHILLCQ